MSYQFRCSRHNDIFLIQDIKEGRSVCTMGEAFVSDKKRSRLQALDSRLSSTSFAKKSIAANPNAPQALPPRIKPFSKPPTPSSATEAQGPAYARLSKLTLEGQVASHLELLKEHTGNNVVESVICELVKGSGKAVRDVPGMLGLKVQDRVLLLDNPAGHGKAVERARRRATKSLANRSSKRLSKREQKLIGSYSLPPQYQKFDLFRPMHEMWRAYAKEAMKDRSGKVIESTLLQLDLHGAILAVVQAKINNQVGIEGIMIREMTNTMALVTKEDKIKVVPKAGSVFIFCLDNLCVTLHGDRFCGGKAAAAERP